jgi:hypothetical protein
MGTHARIVAAALLALLAGPAVAQHHQHHPQPYAGQAQRVQDLYDSMKAEAIAAGEVLISAEVALDRGFAEGGMTPEKLSDLTARAGVAQGRLRAVHLKYHLTTSDLLTDAQKRRYAELRGYR